MNAAKRTVFLVICKLSGTNATAENRYPKEYANYLKKAQIVSLNGFNCLAVCVIFTYQKF